MTGPTKRIVMIPENIMLWLPPTFLLIHKSSLGVMLYTRIYYAVDKTSLINIIEVKDFTITY